MNRLQQCLAQGNLLSAYFQTPHGVRVMALDQLGLSVDVPATAKAAERAGRTAALAGVSLWVVPGGRVAPVARVDTARFQSGLEALRGAVDMPARDARLTLRGRRVVVEPSHAGNGIDAIALERAALASLADWQPYVRPVPASPVARNRHGYRPAARCASSRVL